MLQFLLTCQVNWYTTTRLRDEGWVRTAFQSLQGLLEYYDCVDGRAGLFSSKNAKVSFSTQEYWKIIITRECG